MVPVCVDRWVPNIYRERMNVELTPDQRALVKRAIESGRFSHEEEAVREALALWEERERRRLEILASLDEAEASLAHGEGRPITEESMKVLADEIKDRGRRRLAAVALWAPRRRAGGSENRRSVNPDTPLMFPIVIDGGPLDGMRGRLCRIRNADRLIVSVTLLRRSVAVELDRTMVSPVESTALRPAFDA